MSYEDTGAGIYVSSDAVLIQAIDKIATAGLRGPDAGLAPVDAAIEQGLHNAGFSIASVLVLSPATLAVGFRGDSPDESVELAVDVEVDQDSLILVETTGGALQWLMPARREGGRSTRSDSAGRAIFRIEIGDDPWASEGAQRAWGSGPITGGVLGFARVYILRYLARKTIDLAVDWVEGDMVTGPVPLVVPGVRNLPDARAIADPASWVPGPVNLVSGATIRRVLLLVHGTFSTTVGSFGPLYTTDEGRCFLDGAAARYDLILGFDHKTLACTPTENARDILSSLSALPLGAQCEIDAIAYSRGGLVYRALAEQLLAQSQLRAGLGKAIFVGCTNAGTHLASPRNWNDLADVYTNVGVAAANALALMPGGSTAGLVAGQVIKMIGRFVQSLPEIAIADRYTPGLAAMEPDGITVRTLNGAAARRDCPARYFAVSSSFDARRGTARGFAKDMGKLLADRVTDRLFGTPNDLVVDTASMTEFGNDRVWLAPSDCYTFGDTAEVYHTIYFGSPKVASLLTGWLTDAGEPVNAAATEPQPEKTRRDSLDVSLDGTGFVLPDSIPFSHVGLGGPKPKPSAADAALDRFISAETQQYPRLGTPVNLFVMISPDPLADSDHVAADATDLPVRMKSDVALDISIVPLANCRVVGPDQVSIDLRTKPAGTERFMIEGVAAGPAQVLVEARQGATTIASFTLTPEFITSDSATISARQATTPALAAPDGMVTLRIYEYSENGRVARLLFDLQGPTPDCVAVTTLQMPQNIDLAAYFRGVFTEMEDAWNKASGETREEIYQTFLGNFTDSAKSRTQAILPENIRKMLWEHRKSIKAIQVISEDPVIPWELLYISDPAGLSHDRGGFFAEWGLVRWLHGARLPGPRLALSGDHSRYVIPDYRGTHRPLPGAQLEKDMLGKRLTGCTELVPESLKVVDFLRQDAAACDVLHFACHGRSDTGGAIKSELAMRGFDRGGSMVADSLTIDRVKQNARFGSDGRRALVFLNACQAGQTGYGLTGASGFADAFIRPVSTQGAAAFVGALWSIDDTLALTFADTFYAALDDGKTLVEAVTTARKACQRNSDFTWLAYTVYGNPFARWEKSEARAT